MELGQVASYPDISAAMLLNDEINIVGSSGKYFSPLFMYDLHILAVLGLRL